MAFLDKVVKVDTDKFGIERFAELNVEFAKFKLNKDFQRRYDRIVTLFTYRRDLAYELHHAETNSASEWGQRYKYEKIKARLDTFKPVVFFLDAMQTLLTEVRADEAAKPAPVRRRSYY